MTDDAAIVINMNNSVPRVQDRRSNSNAVGGNLRNVISEISRWWSLNRRRNENGDLPNVGGGIRRLATPFHQSSHHHRPPLQPPRLNPLEDEWKRLLSPWWKSISLFASVANIDRFCKLVSRSGIRLSEAEKQCPLEISANTVLQPTDAFALRLGINMHIRDRKRREDEEAERRILRSSREDGVAAAAAAAVPAAAVGAAAEGVLCLEDLSPPYTTNTNDIDYVIRPLIEKTKSGDVDFAETVLCSAGPVEFISAERNVHSLIIFPATILLGNLISGVEDRMATKASDVWKNNSTYNASTSVTIVNIYFYSLTIVYGLLQIALCSFAALTDRSAAHYLTIPFLFRFADFVLMLISFVFLGPISLFLTAYGESPADNGGTFFYLSISTAMIYIVLCIVAVVFFGMREQRAYEPIPPSAFEGGDGPNPIDVDDCSTIVAQAADYDPETQTNVLNSIKQFLFMENPRREIDMLGFIGRWRKFNLSLRFRESILDSCASPCFEEDALQPPPPQPPLSDAVVSPLPYPPQRQFRFPPPQTSSTPPISPSS